MSWEKVDSGLGKACFKRSDGALVMEVRLFVFEATVPGIGVLTTKRGSRRTWSSAEGAMGQIDKEHPLDGPSDEKSTDLQALTDDAYQQVLSDAAHAIVDAVKTYTGRVRPVHAWKPVAAQVLGVSRLYTKRWQQVLDRGVELGIFAIDDRRYSYPVIEVLESEAKAEPELEEEVEVVIQAAAQPKQSTVTVAATLPDDWEPPRFMDCGHNEGWLTEEGACRACEMKIVPNWMKLAGIFVRPLPEGVRRTQAKVAMGGFEGYCCDADGYYIGGTFNDCRRTGDARCEVHA